MAKEPALLASELNKMSNIHYCTFERQHSRRLIGVEEPGRYLGLEHNGHALRVAGQSVLMSWGLDHGEPLFSSIAEAPAVSIDVLRSICGPRRRVEPLQAIK